MILMFENFDKISEVITYSHRKGKWPSSDCSQVVNGNQSEILFVYFGKLMKNFEKIFPFFDRRQKFDDLARRCRILSMILVKWNLHLTCRFRYSLIKNKSQQWCRLNSAMYVKIETRPPRLSSYIHWIIKYFKFQPVSFPKQKQLVQQLGATSIDCWSSRQQESHR